MASTFDSAARSAPSSPSLIERGAPALAAALAALGILAVHIDTVRSIVAVWLRSETFAHGFTVVPIALWLAWRKRRTLAATPARPWYPALAGVFLAGAVWFVTTSAQVLGVSQFALAFMVQLGIVAVVGLKLARAAAFPLLFLLFAIPAGEILVPTLIDWTADFTVAALRLSGVPVFREVNHFVIPSGAWSVVEACSGLRYLIASLMIGVVYAAVAYRSPVRRAAFIAASIVVPIIANWLRAYMIVMLGHLSDNTLAVGVDHLIYGWVFFGIVMAILFWIGSLWSEPDADEPEQAVAASPPVTAPPGIFYAVALAAIALAAVWRPVQSAVEQPPSPVAPVLSRLAGVGGFAPADVEAPEWTPSYKNHAASMRQAFVADGVPVWLYVAYYRNQAKGRELVTSGNQLVAMGDIRWREVERDVQPVQFGGREIAARRSIISGPRERVVAYVLYWVDGHVTSSDYVAKAWLAWSRLTGGQGDAALIVVHASARDGDRAARDAIGALSPALARMLSQTRERR